MKVLFVISGNDPRYKIAPFIQSQGDSLVAAGIKVDYFPIEGKGIRSYLKSIPKLREHLRHHYYDLIHAHYSLCGWVAVLATSRHPVVVSLMGDDAVGTYRGANKVELKSRLLILFALAIQPFIKAIISKSPNLEKVVFRKKISHLVPNGVRMEQFVLEGKCARQKLGLKPEKKYVLFLGSPTDENKNISLVRAAVSSLKRPDIELINIYDVEHDVVVQYLNAVDVFTLSSFSEGSPNVVKEAMTCGCPMVVTPAGDAAWVIGDTPGCLVASYDPAHFARQVEAALQWADQNGRTNGRQRILDLGLDAQTIAQKIIAIYKSVISK